ncbi:MAG: SAM-dependent chlorinase/fluorinase, partial [Rhodospirillaceae bacterium]|nr:SAM-dependent chlorinase/fluorinase [Rhodospirillaceae bacterium]
WRPSVVSATFHGRDVFAPIAAHLARFGVPPSPSVDIETTHMEPGGVVDPAARVILVDPYGNLVTGFSADSVSSSARVDVKGHHLACARRFGDCRQGEGFWYKNANGLVEVAVNKGNAAKIFKADVGCPVFLV